ncbi:serine/threonine-protein kinase [Chlorogloeopsis sp. ULAP02]|uniref:serine/threonine-protein kinase n=1 Tax=Chlorogloeopsis sp. ULAP02 TaxID=3107926 RepID=UPI003134DA89
MTCCLNPACHNPPNLDGTMFCSNCGTGLVVLRNRYRPIKSLGGGGFGKTYLAEDIDKLNERCVIKQFAPQVQGTASLNKATELFEQEARRLQQLGEHPQIPTLLAYFEQDNRLYLVQQFINGQNLLAELQQQGTFNEQKLRELLLDLLEILKTVHQHKVIHRDIKPENIIRRGDRKLVLIDFGASKQLTMTVMTQPGTAIGSFGYAPLEQMQGGKAYPASDLYSVGATCFHLLSGISPWELWKRQGYGWVTSWQKHLQQPVSQDLGRVLNKLLQEEYQQRYQSAEEVLQDLNPPPPPPPPVIATPQTPPSQPVTAPSQPQALTPVASTKPVVTPKIGLKNLSIQNTKFRKRLLVGAAITLVGLIGTQIYGYVRYGLFPTSPIFVVKSFLSSLVQETGHSDAVYSVTGHSDQVYSVAITPDGKTFASGSGDGNIKLWNLATGEQIRTLSGQPYGVYSVTISPDGKTLVGGGGGDGIKQWNLATGEQIRTFTGHSGIVYSVAISPDGKTLASGSGDGTIKLWNLATGELIRTLRGHSQQVNSVAISPDGKTLASGSINSNIKLWNLATGKEIRTLTASSRFIPVAISPDGKTLASGGEVEDGFFSPNIKLWNLVTGEQILKWPSGVAVSLILSPDSKTVVSGSSQEIELWDMVTGKQIRILTGHNGWVRSVAISPDGKILVSGGEDKTIKMWRLK